MGAPEARRPAAYRSPIEPPYRESGPPLASSCSVAPSAGCRNRAPRGSGAPSWKNTSTMPGSAARSARRSVSARESDRETATPPCASAIAGPNASAHGSVAPSACRAAHPLTAPGTVIESGPSSGMATPCRARSASASTPAGARPLALIATVEPSGRCTNANRSPPTPQLCG